MTYSANEGRAPLEPQKNERFQHATEHEFKGTPSGPPTAGQKPAPYYTPPPSSADTSRRARPRRRLVALGVLAALALGAGTWYALGPDYGSAPLAPPTSKATSETVLLLSQTDMDSKATEGLKKLLSGSSRATDAAVSLNQDQTQQDALHAANAKALTNLSQDAPKMSQELQSGRRVLYRVHLLDYLAQDGDVVEVFVDGISLGAVSLANAGTEVLIPLTSGASAQMKVVAIADGGGGVTFGMVSSLNEAKTRVMQVGEFEQWTVAVK